MLRPQRQSSRSPVVAVSLDTPDGLFIAHFSEHGLTRLDFPASLPPATCRVSSPKNPPQIREWTQLAQVAVLAILSGDDNVAAPPLDLAAGTAFQQKVWSALQKIGFGKTKTYSEIARAIGFPKATRAVGNACGANPIPLFIPCHRVLASGGEIGGFSGGMFWKMKLLAAEGTLPEVTRTARETRQRSFSFGTGAA